jgi:hypothetical protein
MKAASKPAMLLTGATTGGNRARQWNRWRERYNPLRGLNIARCVTLLEQYQRGEMADPQWVYFFIEQSDADLFAILERREAAILQLDWDIKIVSEKGWGREMGVGEGDARRQDFDEGLAAEQASALREAYEGIDNLYEAISHLQLATFRGFAHCEKYRNADGDLYHLELVDQWNVVRDLLRGRWKYNPDALSTTFDGISDDNLIDPADFLIRERDRHVNRLALLKFIRTNLSEKDWDAFIEIYGIPSGVVIGPAGVPSDKENEYEAAAQAIAEGGSGYLPNGSDYKPNTLPGGTAPFRPRLDFLTEKLVLAGTGGLLTMLAQSGSGTLAGGAHQQAFETIARAEARKISELFQRQLDREIIEHHFPGCAVLAYFELAAHEPLDPGAIADHAQRFAAAGYRIDLAQLAEKSGYRLTDGQAPDANASSPSHRLFNVERNRPNPARAFDESQHPRASKGTSQGGQFIVAGAGASPTQKPPEQRDEDDRLRLPVLSNNPEPWHYDPIGWESEMRFREAIRQFDPENLDSARNWWWDGELRKGVLQRALKMKGAEKGLNWGRLMDDAPELVMAIRAIVGASLTKGVDLLVHDVNTRTGIARWDLTGDQIRKLLKQNEDLTHSKWSRAMMGGLADEIGGTIAYGALGGAVLARSFPKGPQTGRSAALSQAERRIAANEAEEARLKQATIDAAKDLNDWFALVKDYNPFKIPMLKKGLEKAGIELHQGVDTYLRSRGIAASFEVNATDGSVRLCLKERPTFREVFHELGHVQTYQRLLRECKGDAVAAAKAYQKLGQPQREVEVYENWQKRPKNWNQLSEEDRLLEEENYKKFKAILDQTK